MVTHATSGKSAENDLVPYSAGTSRSVLSAPPGACDCHHHIFDTRVPSTPPERARPDALVGHYRMLQRRIGTDRSVVVTASNYMFDNDATLHALEQLGDSARGIAVVGTGITDAELEQLHQRGVRGIRFTMIPATPWDDVRTLARRVSRLNWHLQFNVHIEDVVANEALIRELPVPIVFDHLGRIKSLSDGSLPTILRLIETGKVWIKASGVYVVEPQGAPNYPSAVAVARKYMEVAPERVVWGSDWPHPSAKVLPDDTAIFDLIASWAMTPREQHMVLVTNPEALYGFERIAPATDSTDAGRRFLKTG